MAIQESLKRLLIIGAVVLAIFCIFLGFGCWCLSYVDVTHSTRLSREYMRTNTCTDTDLTSLYCSAFVPHPPSLLKCECDFPIVVEQDIKGAVTLYYELEEFDQTKSSYASSKDDQQLLGTPGDRPAESCGNYSYYNTLPIFPCGEIADSIFNDTFTLRSNDIAVPVEYTDLLAGDTLKFRNPSPEVLKNFSAPIHWGQLPNGERPWEADTDLKGVENPAFRAWMDTGLKRKPVWRVRRAERYSAGLPAGNYTVNIMIHYGVDRYDGPRTFILEGVYTEAERKNVAWGVVLLLLAFALLGLGTRYIFTQWKSRQWASG